MTWVWHWLHRSHTHRDETNALGYGFQILVLLGKTSYLLVFFSYFHVHVLHMWCVLHVCGYIHVHVHVETQDWCWDASWIALPPYLWRQGCSNQAQSSTIWLVSLVSFPWLSLPRLELQVLSHSHTAYGDSGDPNFCLLACLASGKGLTAEPSP